MIGSLSSHWLFLGLSKRFSLVYASVFLGWILLAIPWILERIGPAIVGWRPPLLPEVWVALQVPILLGAAATIALAVLGAVVARWVATGVYHVLPQPTLRWHQRGAAAVKMT